MNSFIVMNDFHPPDKIFFSLIVFYKSEMFIFERIHGY
jgi:hypothetical protein